MGNLLSPKEVMIIDQEGNERKYTLSKFPAVQGREIVAKYPISAMPKIGDYAVSEETMLKLMAFVEVESGPTTIRLSTKNLVDNHVPDWEALAKIEMAMMEYNCSFFRNGRISNTLADFAQRALQLISKTLTDSSARSSQETKPPFTS